SLDGEHAANNGIQKQVDLRLTVAALLGAERDGAHLVNGDGFVLSEVGKQAVGEGIHLFAVVAVAQETRALKLVIVRSIESVNDLLRRLANLALPGTLIELAPRVLALPSGEGILKPLERTIDVVGRVPSARDAEGRMPDRIGIERTGRTGLGGVSHTSALEKLLDLVDVVAPLRASDTRKGSRHQTIVPHSH